MLVYRHTRETNKESPLKAQAKKITMAKRTGRNEKQGSNQKYSNVIQNYDDNDDDVRLNNTAGNRMSELLDHLMTKRASMRERALSSIIEALSNKFQHEFCENNYFTVLQRCMNSMKQRSSTEKSLASRAIGLLALTVGRGHQGHEIFENSLPQFSDGLKVQSGSEVLKASSIMDALAIITFVGAEHSGETEGSMQVFWQFIHSISSFKESENKDSVVVLATGISAWSFLLSTLEGWILNYNHWQGAIYYFLGLLKGDDDSVRNAACEALATIIEKNCFEKFVKESTDHSILEGDTRSNGFPSREELKNEIIKQINSLTGDDENSCKKDVSSLKFLKNGFSPVTTRIGGFELKVSRWSQLVQLNFLKRFLGNGFATHVKENQLLLELFGRKPIRTDNLTNVPKFEEVKVRVFMPEVRKESSAQRILNSSNSALNKGKTKLLEKQRALSQGMKLGHYAIGEGSEET